MVKLDLDDIGCGATCHFTIKRHTQAKFNENYCSISVQGHLLICALSLSLKRGKYRIKGFG